MRQPVNKSCMAAAKCRSHAAFFILNMIHKIISEKRDNAYRNCQMRFYCPFAFAIDVF